MTNVLHIDSHSPITPAEPRGGVTELVLTRDAPEQLALLLPMMAYTSRQTCNRWITWIGPQSITRQELEQFGVDTRFVRLIHCADVQQILWITWEALNAGNSHMVIASPGRLTEKELSHLELAARQGQCQGLLLRLR